MTDPNLTVDMLVQGVEEWLARDLPGWATRTRFHARRREGDGLLVLTATSSLGDVGYAVFDRQMSHLYYMETRKDRQRRGVGEQLWERVKANAAHRDITASGDTQDGQRRLQAWGFQQADGMWTWRRPQ